MTEFNLNYLLESLDAGIVTLGARASTRAFWGDPVPATAQDDSFSQHTLLISLASF